MFQIFEFMLDGSISVLPISWVKNGKVKYDAKKAADYMKKDMIPYKKWKEFEVKPVTQKIYDNLELALKAEKFLLENTDIETSDLEADHQLIKLQPRIRKPNKKFINSSESDESEYSSGDEERSDGNPPILKDIPENEAGSRIQRENISEETMNENNQIVAINVATREDINEIVQSISEVKEEIVNINKKIDKLLDFQNILQHKYNAFAERKNPDLTIFNVTFPLSTIDDVNLLEEDLKSEDSQTAFKQFILSFGGDSLKTIIKYIISNLYDLDVQSKINWTGRETKLSTKDLKQTNIIIDVMRSGGKRTQVECEEEYKYHLQHSSDRRRAAKKLEKKKEERPTQM